METERLFFALWPPGALGDRMQALASARLRRGRVIPAARLHVTLVFLGELNAEGRAAAMAAAGRVSGEPFELVLTELGCWRRRGIVWLGPAETPEALGALYHDLSAELAAVGFTSETRRFRPHVTVARRAVTVPETLEPGLRWPVAEFQLVRSVLGPGGAAYDTVGAWRLEPRRG